MNLAPIVVMIGALFVCDRVLVGRFHLQFQKIYMYVKHKLVQHSPVYTVFNPKSSIGRVNSVCGTKIELLHINRFFRRYLRKNDTDKYQHAAEITSRLHSFAEDYRTADGTENRLC